MHSLSHWSSFIYYKLEVSIVAFNFQDKSFSFNAVDPMTTPIFLISYRKFQCSVFTYYMVTDGEKYANVQKKGSNFELIYNNNVDMHKDQVHKAIKKFVNGEVNG